MSIFGKLKAAWLARKVAKRFEEDRVKNGFLRAAKTLGLAVLPVVVMKLTDACPDLMTPSGAVALVGGIAGAVLLQTRKKGAGAATAAAGVTGLAGMVWTSAQEQISKMCGSDFLTQLPTVLTAALVVGLGVYMSTHKKEEEQ